MNDIQTRQNQPENLKLLAAQRQLYSEAKRSMSSRLVFSILLLLYPLAAAFIPALKDTEVWVAIGSVVFLAFTYFFFKRKEQRQVEIAAKIQEQFDVAVLGIPKEPMPYDNEPEPSDINNAARRHFGQFNIQLPVKEPFYKVSVDDWKRMRLWDWYEVPSNIEPDRAAIFCQKSNLLWDYQQRQWFMNFFLLLALAVFVIPLAIACATGLPTWEYVTKLLSLSLPFLLLCFDNYRSHQEIVHEQEQKSHSITTILNGKQEISPDRLRQTQDAIFSNRNKSALVPDLLYWWLRNRFQPEMEDNANAQK